VRFDVIAPAGFRILAALSDFATDFPSDIFITSATDGIHSGPTDPHKTGEAIDIQSNQWPPETKQAVCRAIVERSEGHGAVAVQVGGGWGTDHFWGWVEDEGGPNNHIHVQRKRGTTYP
jgi:hypothetical protein